MRILQVQWEDGLFDWHQIVDRVKILQGAVQLFSLFKIMSELGPHKSERQNVAAVQQRGNWTEIQFRLVKQIWLVYKKITNWPAYASKFQVDDEILKVSFVPAFPLNSRLGCFNPNVTFTKALKQSLLSHINAAIGRLFS